MGDHSPLYFNSNHVMIADFDFDEDDDDFHAAFLDQNTCLNSTSLLKNYSFPLAGVSPEMYDPMKLVPDPEKLHCTYILKGSEEGCLFCGRRQLDLIDVKLKKCMGCRRAQYCSIVCQNKDRATHKPFCFPLSTTRVEGQCFVVSCTPPPLDQWVAVCLEAKKLILSGKVHPDDIVFNTSVCDIHEGHITTEENREGLMQMCIYVEDIVHFEYFLRCGGGSTLRVYQQVCSALRQTSPSIPLHGRFIRLWLAHSFHLKVCRNVELMQLWGAPDGRSLGRIIQWIQLWTDDLGVPIKALFERFSIHGQLKNRTSAQHRKLCKSLFSRGLDPGEPSGYHARNDTFLNSREPLPLCASEMLALYKQWQCTQTTIKMELDRAGMHRDLIPIVLNYFTDCLH